MPVALFITHPEVSIEPHVPVVRWGLSPAGVVRMTAFAASPLLEGVRQVWCSTETKAVEAAKVVCARLGLVPGEIESLGENDRSATGFLHREAFERAADAFFAEPGQSFQGWERAIDAQRRIVKAVHRALQARPAGGDIAIVSHGAVGTLLKCHLKGIAITRAEDQGSQGHWYAFDAHTHALLHDWRPLEAASAG